MLIWGPTKMSGPERNNVCITEPQEPTGSISAGMKTFKGIWIMEEGCVQENNDLACNSLEELNTFQQTCCCEAKKMQTSDVGAICC